jgi:hypothetical protein
MKPTRRFTAIAAAAAVVAMSAAGVSATATRRHSHTAVAQHDLRIEVERFLASHPDIALTIKGHTVPSTVIAVHAGAASASPATQLLAAPALTDLVRAGMASVTLDALLLLDGRAHRRRPTSAAVDAWYAEQRAAANKAGTTGPDNASYVTGQQFGLGDRHAVESHLTIDAERRALLGGAKRDTSKDLATLRTWLRSALARYDVTVTGVSVVSTPDLATYLI